MILIELVLLLILIVIDKQTAKVSSPRLGGRGDN